MDKLAAILRVAGVDVSTLGVIFQADLETIHGLTVPGAQAIETWEKLRGLVPQTGFWPVLLGDDANAEALLDHLKRLRYPRAARILEEAATINPVEWFENRRLDDIDWIEWNLEEREEFHSWPKGVKLLSTEGPYRGMPQGPWPEDVQPSRAFRMPYAPIVFRDPAGRVLGYFHPTSGEPLPRIHIGLVSTPLGWQSPAYLRFGAWNKCPNAAEHVALFKYWGERYGAEVVGMAGHEVEMRVARPPTDRDAALELAAQQYLYCQWAQTLQRLAASLLGGTVWFFWRH